MNKVQKQFKNNYTMQSNIWRLFKKLQKIAILKIYMYESKFYRVRYIIL